MLFVGDSFEEHVIPCSHPPPRAEQPPPSTTRTISSAPNSPIVLSTSFRAVNHHAPPLTKQHTREDSDDDVIPASLPTPTTASSPERDPPVPLHTRDRQQQQRRLRESRRNAAKELESCDRAEEAVRENPGAKPKQSKLKQRGLFVGDSDECDDELDLSVSQGPPSLNDPSPDHLPYDASEYILPFREMDEEPRQNSASSTSSSEPLISRRSRTETPYTEVKSIPRHRVAIEIREQPREVRSTFKTVDWPNITHIIGERFTKTGQFELLVRFDSRETGLVHQDDVVDYGRGDLALAKYVQSNPNALTLRNTNAGTRSRLRRRSDRATSSRYRYLDGGDDEDDDEAVVDDDVVVYDSSSNGILADASSHSSAGKDDDDGDDDYDEPHRRKSSRVARGRSQGQRARTRERSRAYVNYEDADIDSDFDFTIEEATKPKQYFASLKENFEVVSPNSTFAKRHMKACVQCRIGFEEQAPVCGRDDESGDLRTADLQPVYCQGCSYSFHRDCLGARYQRDHLVTKTTDQHCVLQCRYCIFQVPGKDALTPRTDHCQSCRQPGQSCRPFSDRKTSKQEEALREANNGVDPPVLVDPTLLNAADNVLVRCVQCRRAWHPQHYDPDLTTSPILHFRRHNDKCDDCVVNSNKKAEQYLAWRPKSDVMKPPSSSASEHQARRKEDNSTPKLSTFTGDEIDVLIKWEGMSHHFVSWHPAAWAFAIGPEPTKRTFLRRALTESLLFWTEEDAVPLEYLMPEVILDVEYVDEPTKESASIAESAMEVCSPSLDSEVEASDEESQSDASSSGASDYAPRPRKPKRKTSTQAKARCSSPSAIMTQHGSLSQESKEREMLRIDQVSRILVKYKHLPHSTILWDLPPTPEKPLLYTAFREAFNGYLSGKYFQWAPSGDIIRRVRDFRKNVRPEEAILPSQPPSLQMPLMEYQLLGVNWMYQRFHQHENAILADEMGLGKTVQVVALIAALVEMAPRCWPFLVIVPNSTVANWQREFRVWAPSVHVVTYYGGQEAQKLIYQYELVPEPYRLRKGDGVRAHVVIMSYNSVVDVHARSLLSWVAWQGLIVDEGQRLKNDKGQLYKLLNQYEFPFRVLMTGTPLQNNIRELFNLLQFVKPSVSAEALEEEYAVLNQENIKKLHQLLGPYFLRRTKTTVLKFLPPMHQLVIPVSMTVLQEKLCKSIIAKNASLLESLLSTNNDSHQNNGEDTRKGKGDEKKARKERFGLNNVLMQLRKCLCHPFVYAETIEEAHDDPDVVLRNLVEASGKLLLLQHMLPQLRAKGHRVLIFSQFLHQLDILEDFLTSIGLIFSRLDGSVSSLERQKRIDAFNAPDSPLFAFLLSTRAGGVGVNLATADTVIIMDPDFNPHQDIQAFSRAHRIGQKKKVLCFQFVTQNSVEEKILQIGRSKMALDHALIERMDTTGASEEDLEAVLKHGAQALFSEDHRLERIQYDEAAVAKLLDRTREVEDDTGATNAEESLKFARVWGPEAGDVTGSGFFGGAGDGEGKQASAVQVAQNVWDHILAAREQEAFRIQQAQVELLGRGNRKRRRTNYKPDGYVEESDADLSDNNKTTNKKKKKTNAEVDRSFTEMDTVDSKDSDTDRAEDLEPPSKMAEGEENHPAKSSTITSKKQTPLPASSAPSSLEPTAEVSSLTRTYSITSVHAPIVANQGHPPRSIEPTISRVIRRPFSRVSDQRSPEVVLSEAPPFPQRPSDETRTPMSVSSADISLRTNPESQVTPTTEFSLRPSSQLTDPSSYPYYPYPPPSQLGNYLTGPPQPSTPIPPPPRPSRPLSSSPYTVPSSFGSQPAGQPNSFVDSTLALLPNSPYQNGYSNQALPPGHPSQFGHPVPLVQSFHPGRPGNAGLPSMPIPRLWPGPYHTPGLHNMPVVPSQSLYAPYAYHTHIPGQPQIPSQPFFAMSHRPPQPPEAILGSNSFNPRAFTPDPTPLTTPTISFIQRQPPRNHSTLPKSVPSTLSSTMNATSLASSQMSSPRFAISHMQSQGYNTPPPFQASISPNAHRHGQHQMPGTLPSERYIQPQGDNRNQMAAQTAQGPPNYLQPHQLAQPHTPPVITIDDNTVVTRPTPSIHQNPQNVEISTIRIGTDSVDEITSHLSSPESATAINSTGDDISQSDPSVSNVPASDAPTASDAHLQDQGTATCLGWGLSREEESVLPKDSVLDFLREPMVLSDPHGRGPNLTPLQVKLAYRAEISLRLFLDHLRTAGVDGGAVDSRTLSDPVMVTMTAHKQLARISLVLTYVRRQRTMDSHVDPV